MTRFCALCFFFLGSFFANSQKAILKKKSAVQDSIKKEAFIKHIGNGYFPTKFFDFDLRYLIKYNQYEALRTGLGGITSDEFSKKLKINSYLVYGFRDHRFKYSIGGGYRLAEKTNTWLNLSYTDDLIETGSSAFLTDKRLFQFFEPRLLNISLFHKHITKAIALEHQLGPKLSLQSKFATSKIDPTYNYNFIVNNKAFSQFNISTSVVALQWSPFNIIASKEEGKKELKETFPKFTLQYTKGFKNVFKSDFNFYKIDFKLIHNFVYHDQSSSELTLVSGIAQGNTPLTHLYHAYPNNINKESVMRRFSVAGITSFETMYFNEFFSDKFTTIQFKHRLKPFDISLRFKPELVLITRYAIGDMQNPDQHENINFSSLEKGYTESGLELNKLFFGFGLSFTYRYGAYHLPNLSDNIALKFTFNVTL